MPADSRFAALGDYGLIGDTRTAALVSPEGSIDWMCLPRFDGSPAFGFLVDRDDGGRFSIAIADGHVSHRAYRDRTATIETSFRSATGDALLSDGMVLDASSDLRPQNLLVRRMTCTRGQVRVRITYDPRWGLPGQSMTTRVRREGLVSTAGPIGLCLRAEPPLDLRAGSPFETVLRAGEDITIVLTVADRQPLVLIPPREAASMLAESERWWTRWCQEIRYAGPHRGPVERSMITLRLLTYAPSGAPVAAPTTSIPAPPGSDQAWDYRYSWPRDASIGIAAFTALRGLEEPRAYLRWIGHATRNTRPRVNVLYTLDGRPGPPETTLRRISPSGDSSSTILRIGNGAAPQHQLDVYGWLVDAGWIMMRTGEPLDRTTWGALASFTDFVVDHWREPDSGIWEIRGKPRHYVHSKLMGWIALDRAITMSDSLPTRPSRVRRWIGERDALSAQIRQQGIDPGRGVYLQAYGAPDLDGSILSLASSGFDDASSPIVRATIDAVRQQLGAGGPLLYRYRPRSDEPRESAFVACSFWLAEALARTGRIDEAAGVFEEMCGLGGALGLYAEQINPPTGGHEGNFPQALSHATMLLAAAALTDSGTNQESSRTRRARAEPPQASHPHS